MRRDSDLPNPVYSDPPALPPDGFDPVSKPDDQARLAEFWLPDRPDPETEPELYTHWAGMMRAPLRFVFASDEQVELFRTTTPFGSSLGGSRVGHSRNWSGAVVVPNTGGRFTRVTGKWVVPGVRSGADPNPAGIDQGSTMWIGLDGAVPWTFGMPQLGSGHYIDRHGQPYYFLWFQWWLRDFDSSPRTISSIPVGPNDEVYANISVLGPCSVLVSIANRTTKTFMTKKIVLLGGKALAPILGATAEWILERPSDTKLKNTMPPNGPLFPLPEYDPIPVTHCATRMNNFRPPGWSPRLLGLTEVLPERPHVVVESAPRKRSQPRRSFLLNYRRPV